MALGICASCEKLVAIRPGPQRWGTRERTWYPIPHEDSDGKPCKGDKRGL